MAAGTDAVPVLPVADLMRALAWYERLGFTVESLYADAGYALLAYEGTEIHLNEQLEVVAGASLSGVYLRVSDAAATHARWSALGVRQVAPLEEQPYGILEFATEDVDGNLWRVGSRIGAPEGVAPDPAGEPAFDPDATSAVWEDEFAAARSAEIDEPVPVQPATVDPVSEHPPSPDAVHGDQGQGPTDGSPGTADSAWYEIVTDGRTCAGCGLDSSDLPARALGAEVRDVVHAFGDLLRFADDEQVRWRPTPTTWSALEYGVHVRDVLTLFAERIMRTLREFDPDLPSWDQEAAIADGMANESDVDAVADDLGRNASVLSQVLREVSDDDWERPARRAGTQRFTIESMARFALHEAVHHKVDAQRSLAGSSPN